MITNYLFRLLFDYRGSISRREYWAGIIVAFMCFGMSQQDSLLSYFVTTRILEIDNEHNFVYNHIINFIVNPSFDIHFPFRFISLYIFINITIKRGRTLSFPLAKSLLIGLFTYLMNSCSSGIAYFASYMSSGISAFSEVSGDNDSIIKIFPVVCYIIIFIGIGCIIYMSICKTDSDRKDEIKRCNTVNSLVAIGKITLIYALAVIICVILCIVFSNLRDIPENIMILCGILVFIYTCVFIYILMKRAKDAEINPVYVVIPFILLAIAVGGITLFSKIDMLAGVSLMSLVCNWVLVAVNLAFLVIIALPSKATINNIEKVETP